MIAPDADRTAAGERQAPRIAALAGATRLFVAGAAVVELRVLSLDKRQFGTLAGYFNAEHTDALVAAVVAADKLPGANTYVTLNPANPALTARAAHRLKRHARETTSDGDVTGRRWIYVDLDAVRPSGIASTNAEHAAALARAEGVAALLVDSGVPTGSIIRSDSGNGAGLLVRVDLPNDADALALVTRLLKALDLRFSDEAVKIDTGVGNAARIVRFPGTMNRKGDSTAERPHRRSALLHVPEDVVVCPRDVLERIADLAPADESGRARASSGDGFDLGAWLVDHSLEVRRTKAWQGGTVHELAECPFDNAHVGGSAFAGVHPSGAVYFRCFHNGCLGKDWRELRALLEPDRPRGRASAPREKRERGPSLAAQLPHAINATEEILRGLAALSRLAYDRRRRAAAEQLGVRLGVLDAEVAGRRGEPDAGEAADADLLRSWAVDPWPAPVTTVDLLDELTDTYRRHVVLPAHGAEAMALWALHAWCHDAATISPLLATISPEKRCGKTTALLLLRYTTPRPLAAANVTTAVLFRAVERWRPTLLLDEADTYLDGADDLRGIINSGHIRAMAQTIRCVGEDNEPQTFSTWTPKALALIQHGRGLHETLRDRAIILPMRRRLASERIERLRGDMDAAFCALRRRAARWAADSIEQLRGADPALPAGLGDRARDNWRLLIQIADLAAGDWPPRARAAAIALSGDEVDADSVRVLLLADLADLLDGAGGRIASQTLAERLASREERPWPEWRHGRPISARQIATLLRPLGIAPRTIRQADGTTAKGYLTEDPALHDALARYTPLRSVTASQPAPDAAQSGFSIRNSFSGVTDRKTREPAPDGACDGVTDGKGGYQGRELWDL